MVKRTFTFNLTYILKKKGCHRFSFMSHQIREDAKSGVYVVGLTVKNVENLTDVSQLLVKVCYTFGLLSLLFDLQYFRST